MNKKLAQKLRKFVESVQLYCLSVDDNLQAFDNSKEYKAVKDSGQDLLAELDNLPEPAAPPQPPAAA